MRTIYLRQKKSGNYEIADRKTATVKFTTKKALQEFWQNTIENQPSYLRYKDRKKIVKQTYRLSQTYYNSFADFYKTVKS